LLGLETQARRLAPAARGGIPVETRIPASERTSQKLSELLTQGVAEGDARSELIKLAVRKILEGALEAEVAKAVGRGYYESGAAPTAWPSACMPGCRARRCSAPGGLRRTLGKGLCGLGLDEWTQRETVVSQGETKYFRLSIDANGKTDIQRSE